MKFHIHFCLLVPILLIGHSEIKAQNDSYWLGMGLGGGPQGLVFTGNGSYQSGNMILSLRYSATGQLFGDEYWDLGFLIGVANNNPHIHLSASAGLSTVGGTRFSENEGFLSSNPVKYHPILGLPIEAQLFFNPDIRFGIGFYGLLNVNKHKTFGGVSVTFRIGRIYNG